MDMGIGAPVEIELPNGICAVKDGAFLVLFRHNYQTAQMRCSSAHTNQVLSPARFCANGCSMKLIGKDLVCERGERIVFANLDFAVSAGELLVLKGPNGAGKTSLLRMIAGLNEPASGSMQLDGGQKDLSIGQQCHFIAHQNAVKPNLTVRENLAFWAGFLAGSEIDEALDAFNMCATGTLLGSIAVRRPVTAPQPVPSSCCPPRVVASR